LLWPARRRHLAIAIQLGLVGDLHCLLIVQAPLLAQDPEDVFGVAVALGEKQQLGDLRAAREDLSEQFLADRAQHRADLIRRHHAAIERR